MYAGPTLKKTDHLFAELMQRGLIKDWSMCAPQKQMPFDDVLQWRNVVTLPTPFLLPALGNYFLLLMETLNTATWEGGINVYNREGAKRSTIVTESYAFPLKSGIL